MRRIALIMLLIVSIFLLCGCSEEHEVENQAYGIILGIDKDRSEEITLTVLIPTIVSSGTESKDSSSGSSSYHTISAAGKTTAEALESLQWSVPRELNLSHLKMVVVSESFAMDSEFKETISKIAETFHLYTSARFVVCKEKAQDFLDGQKAIIGSRLSSEIDAMFEHYIAHGYIPDTNFADLYYGLNSYYSDPMAVMGFSSQENITNAQPAVSAIFPVENNDNPKKSVLTRHYIGAAVFKNGVMTAKLDSQEMLFANLILGSVDTFGYQYEDKFYQMVPIKKPKINLEINNNQISITICIKLSGIPQGNSIPNEILESSVEANILKAIKNIQLAGIEPFGFAEKAASKFATIQEWLVFDWHERFETANIDVDLQILQSES